jgi:hypothetical protein
MSTKHFRKSLTEAILKSWRDLTEYDSVKVISRLKRLPVEMAVELFDGVILVADTPVMSGVRFNTTNERGNMRAMVYSSLDILGIPNNEVSVQFDNDSLFCFIAKKYSAESGGEPFGNADLTALITLQRSEPYKKPIGVSAPDY